MEHSLLDHISTFSLFFTSSGLSHHLLILGPYFSFLHLDIDPSCSKVFLVISNPDEVIILKRS